MNPSIPVAVYGGYREMSKLDALFYLAILYVSLLMLLWAKVIVA